ncbi:uncharacterized protein LOC100826452 [Brachypodium distachyon]|uniref:Uncharacterized protein n=1 Tax=Brachypodium distachyon TaxID=15368 RepID=I1I0K1_BRADI|nr:uncharacterized protein LOC100826452 [Brachypodium distachyon]KQJ94900.1 hypothetical protein BRADI_3g13940v3 [Brachypodium distachyon]|eukprot:XP_003571334.2 uncharacterized protein LOC100826452 [Brachypodium distachyon]
MAAARKLPLLLLALLAAAAVPALAASGGAMGGRVSSSRSKSPSSSSSYSRPHWDWEPHHSYHYSTFHIPVGTPPPPPPRGGSGEGKASAAAAGEGSWFRWEVLVFGIVLLGIAVCCCSYYFAPQPRARMSIVKLQVALLGYAKPFQRELNDIAENVDSSERRWYKHILTETICSLRRHRDCCVSSSVSVDFKYGGEAWEEHFDIISMEERCKFDVEALYNMEGVERKKAYHRKQNWSRNEYVVVTILVAADGALELPEITRPADLEAAARKLLSIPEGNIRGIHVLWTPQEENDVLTEEKLLADYPHLKPCHD